MEIKLEIPTAQVGKFSDIKLCYYDSSDKLRKVSLNIDFNNLYRFSEDTKSLSFDFFLIASTIYGIDNLITRYEYSINGWTRELKVTFPVRNVAKWNASAKILNDALTFLTGDSWDISFEKLNVRSIFKEKKKKKILYDKSNYQFISLFSGGLDSLVGAVDLLESLSSTKRLLLVSHFDSNSAGPNTDQRTLNSYLETIYKNKSDWIQAKVYLSHHDVDAEKIEIETSYRSRSILFIAIGSYLQNNVKNSNKLIIPENGTISLNYPMTPSRSSSLSTRTTHPYFFLKIQELFDQIGIKCKLENPYSLLTKGEIVANCKNLTNLKGIYESSVSCSKSGRKMNWDRKTGTRHCGVCIPCIYRRSGLHKSGLDQQLYGIDILNKVNPGHHDDVLALANYLTTPVSKEEVKRGLITNSSSTIENLDDYADLILLSREEVKKWIIDKGNKKIKNLFKIK
ncbi:MAG TPA: 7-cyano-7-deazaguanine synthase [Ignavibacteria bacterium]|nr:7-cyano-7-deazaguanine synthase [Ignavibacteriaceae bacterium]HRK00978.1 7-cyano-7-deazaguanine synthase [Ignavibacteria bacterium]